jgi:proline iminopeptidase
MKATRFLAVVVVCAGAAAQSKLAGERESRIPVQGAALYCREVGRGKPIIVLHGGPDFDISYLLPELDRLSDKFHLIYYDVVLGWIFRAASIQQLPHPCSNS